MNPGTLAGAVMALVMFFLLAVNASLQPNLGCITDTECENMEITQ